MYCTSCSLCLVRQRDTRVVHALICSAAFLDLSERKAYNPLPWTQAFKDEGGRPTNVLVQQDAHEYFNLLCDRIERGLKGTPQEKLLSNVLAGKFANQMLCQGGCGSVRESPEDFYCITLQLQHQANVADSLESMITGEVIQDFTCDVCGKKARRGCVLLIMHRITCAWVHRPSKASGSFCRRCLEP